MRRLATATLFAMGWLSAPAFAQDGSTDPHDYVTYTPAACAQAVERTRAFHTRDFRTADTGRFDPAAEQTPLPSVLAAARACIDRFRVPDVAPRDLPGLITVYATLGNDSAAAAAASRWFAIRAADGVAARVEAISEVVHTYAMAWRFGAIESLLRELATITDRTARYAEVDAHAWLLAKFGEIGDDGAARRAAERILAIARPLRPSQGTLSQNSPEDQQLLGGVATAYSVLAYDTVEHGGGQAGSRAVRDSAVATFGPAVVQWTNLEMLVAVLDQPAKRVHARYWLGTAGDTVHPAPGRPALIAIAPRRSHMPALRRLAAKMPTLDVTIVRPTRGAFRGDGMLEPNDEVEQLRAYYFGALGFRGTLAIEVTEYTYIPDGRRQAKPTLVQADYTQMEGVIVVDREGIVRRVYGEPIGMTEEKIARAIGGQVARVP